MKTVKSFVLSLMAVMAMCAMASCAGGDSIEGKWKVDDACIKKLMGSEASMGSVGATVEITADKAIATVNMNASEGEMSFDMTLEAECDYTKTDTEITVTPKDVKLVKLELPDAFKKIAEAQGMSEDQMKENFAKDFTSKKPEATTMSYTLAEGKLTLKDKDIELVLVRE